MKLFLKNLLLYIFFARIEPLLSTKLLQSRKEN